MIALGIAGFIRYALNLMSIKLFCTFKNYVERFFESKIKVFRSDGGGGFLNTSFKLLFSSTCIIH